ncbi:hypothetical protein PybrP1_002995 [[Pythium] brassicae (nom. inval.)]|nr:hypothetical protein PybrP1_002995 [[Pythium] brassicae (nom. inval.)]
MKYFQAYLNQSNEQDEIDISVHCDVDVFEWLVAYMHRRPQHPKPLKHHTQQQQQQQPRNPPRLSLDNIASILVSSEFLQMEPLVDECVRFIAARMQAFLQLRVDLSCLSDATVAKIANRCSAEHLQVLHDPKNKILSKLHTKKLDAYVRRLGGATTRTSSSSCVVVDRCVNCDAIYLHAAESVLVCPRGRRQICVHGELVSRHEARADWRLDAFVRELTWGGDKVVAGGVGVPSNAVYWYLWASTNCFFCSTCKRWFALLELRGCAFHSGVISGVGCDAKYSCCGARVFDWDDLGGRHDSKHSTENISLRFCADGDLDADQDANGSTEDGVTDSRADANGADGSAAFEKRVETICKLPGLWDLIRSCERRQFRALQRQEKDRVRHQLLVRRLVQMRKSATV